MYAASIFYGLKGKTQRTGAFIMKTKTDIRKLLIMNLPCVIFGFLMSNIGEAWRLTEGVKESQRFLAFTEMIPEAFANPLSGFCAEDILFGIAAAVVMRLLIAVKGSNQKKYRHGREYGSARWGTAYMAVSKRKILKLHVLHHGHE